MSISLTEEKPKEKPKEKPTQYQSSPTCRRSTSMFIDRMLWNQVRKTSVDLGITATEFVEKALKDRLEDIKESEKQPQTQKEVIQ